MSDLRGRRNPNVVQVFRPAPTTAGHLSRGGIAKNYYMALCRYCGVELVSTSAHISKCDGEACKLKARQDEYRRHKARLARKRKANG